MANGNNLLRCESKNRENFSILELTKKNIKAELFAKKQKKQQQL